MEHAFVLESVAIQCALALRLKTILALSSVYVFDSTGHFDGAAVSSADNIRYLTRDDAVAVLSATAQKVLSSGAYLTYLKLPHAIDDKGIYIL